MVISCSPHEMTVNLASATALAVTSGLSHGVYWAYNIIHQYILYTKSEVS